MQKWENLPAAQQKRLQRIAEQESKRLSKGGRKRRLQLAHQELENILNPSLVTRDPKRLTPNQVVACNVTELREEKKWTQEEAARHLEPYLGTLWSKATFSLVERSVAGTRIKTFDADELAALALAFDVAVWRLFVPPTHVPPARRVQVNVGGEEILPGPFTVAMVRQSGRRDDETKLAAVAAVRHVVIEYLWAKHFGGKAGNLGTIEEQTFFENMRKAMEAIGLVPDKTSVRKAVTVIRKNLTKALRSTTADSRPRARR